MPIKRTQEPTTGDEADAAGRAWYESLGETDLALVDVYHLPEGAAAVLREALFQDLAARVMELHLSSVQTVLMFLKVVEECDGCTSPAETFIRDLTRDHYRYGIDLEMIQSLIEGQDGFAVNFADAVNDARRMLRQYPRLFTAEQQEPAQ